MLRGDINIHVLHTVTVSILRLHLSVTIFTQLMGHPFCSSVKKRRNWHRHDYSELDDGSKVSVDNLMCENYIKSILN